MPFAVDIPFLYYNKVTFREVGLDPEKPPQGPGGAAPVSEKILKRDAPGNVVRSGIALDIDAWHLQVTLQPSTATSMWNNENGRDGRATKVLFNGTGRWLLPVVARHGRSEGLAFNVGRNPTACRGLPGHRLPVAPP